ncbi:MAG: translation initiation factor IF-2 [Pirellulaceae bacterium]
MPIRIYALAKELNIENKDLVEICNKAGLSGKGSALASLTDEEVERVKSFMSAGSRPAKPAPSQPAPAPAPSRPVARPAPETKAAPAPVTRDTAFAPARKEIRVLGGPKRGKPSESSSKDESKPAAKSEPVVKMAPMPEVQQPVAKKVEGEPKAQKPDIKLPKDAYKPGNRAPLESMIKSNEKKTKSGGAKKSEGGDSTTAAPLTGRGARTRRGRTPAEGAGAGAGAGGGEGMGNLREARTIKRKTRTRRGGRDDDDSPRRGHLYRRKGPKRDTSAPRKDKAVLQLPCTVRSFSEAAGVPAGKVLMAVMSMTNDRLTINSQLDDELVGMLVEQFEVEIEVRAAESVEDVLASRFELLEDEPDSLQTRPPVVTFLGHVDHGKTSLLDRVIGIDVVSGEAGGITQHIRAYQVSKDGRKIAFVDTPGHEAFTEMRARGANVTDIAVLVVAADDGIMPQTEEAISHAKAAGVPIVVALNKIDLPGVDETKAMQGLATNGLLPSAWGGEIEVVKTSAITGEGIDELLETLLLTADIHEYKANPDRAAFGTCLEAEQEPGRGVIAKVIVQNGSLRVGDIVVCGRAHGRVKAMYDTLKLKTRVKKAGPSRPVNITGLDVAPEAGDRFYVLDDIAEAREIAEMRASRSRQTSLSGVTTKVSFENFQEMLESGTLGRREEVVTINLIIRADVRGSIEAIQKELSKLAHPEVQVKILQASVGGITAADVTLADASDAVIIGFNVIPDDAARALADERQVEIRRYDVIYKVSDDIKLLLEGKLKPEKQVVELGSAVVLKTFDVSRSGTIAGCRVLRGNIERGCRIRVSRDNRVLGDYDLDSLRREKDDVKEVRQGMECGIKLAGFNDVKEGDVLESYKIEEVARKL